MATFGTVHTNAPLFAPRHVASPYYAASPARDSNSDDSCSDDGSVGPRHVIAPFDAKKTHLINTTTTKAHNPYQPEAAFAAVTPAVPTKPTQRPRLSADVAVKLLTTAMTYLPLADINAARAVGPVFTAAANRVAPQPLGTDAVSFVRWEPQVLRTALPAPKPRKGPATAAPPPAVMFPWRCLACGIISVGPRQCQHCRTPLAQSACRVFLGQLRKDLSAELATALVRSVAPDVTILHMESHTNGSDGRGKGCAWAYVSSVEDAARVTALHKRVFIDLDKDGGEGFWVVDDDRLKPHLATFAETVGAQRGRPVWMPRQPLVAELPAKSMIAEYVAASGF